MSAPTLPISDPKRAPYVTPKIVVLGNVRDLTLSGGSVVADTKVSRGKAM